MKGGPGLWPARDRAALEFASQMTLDASKVTDDEVNALRIMHGEEKLVAMVLLLASSNFQDRFLLGLGTRLEEGGPVPPISARFSREAPAPSVPAREKPEDRHGPAVAELVDDPEWIAIGFDALQKNLNTQRANPGRIRVPSHEEVMRVYPADYPKPKSTMRIKWSMVCFGYQPEFAAAWSRCMKAFEEEAKLDEVFAESLFWVVTRTIHCFY